MTVLPLAQQIVTCTQLLPPLAACTVLYLDSLELLHMYNYHPNLLPSDILSQLPVQACSIPRLDLQGSDITWDDLAALSPLFTQLRFLDIRNCPHLNEEWAAFKFWERGQHQGFQKLVARFPYHQSLEIQLTDTLSITSSHTDPATDPGRKQQRFGFIIYNEKGAETTSATNLETRPTETPAEREKPYLLPAGFIPFQEKMKREEALPLPRQSVCSRWLKA